MPYISEFTINIPSTDLLTYLFPPDNEEDVNQPIWISAADPSILLNRKQAVQWIRRMAVGLKKLQLKTGDVVLIISPNHVFVPVAYIGSIACGAVFSGLTPLASVNGNHCMKTYDIRQGLIIQSRDGISDGTDASEGTFGASQCCVKCGSRIKDFGLP
jgi:hypothetical protein